MIILVYVALAFFLYWGAKFSKMKECNEELMSFDHTKLFPVDMCSLASAAVYKTRS